MADLDGIKDVSLRVFAECHTYYVICCQVQIYRSRTQPAAVMGAQTLVPLHRGGCL